MKAYILTCLLLFSTFGIGSICVPHLSRFLSEGTYQVIDREAKVELSEALPSDINIHLYTSVHQIEGPGDLIPMEDFAGDLDGTSFTPIDASYIFIHGWRMDYTSFKGVLPMILTDNRANVFIVDYPKISKLSYELAIGKLPSVADILATALKAIQEKYSWDLGTVNLIGHSMGGQMSGLIGAKLDGALSAIQALDPAGPHFEDEDPSMRLDPTDAQFVQVIHTNGGLLGYRNNLGDADYYPNGGGISQAGCGWDLVGLCAHFRAIFYYYESISSNQFVAQSCLNYEEYENGKCKNNPTTIMGKLEPDRAASKNYYLNTNKAKPYGQG